MEFVSLHDRRHLIVLALAGSGKTKLMYVTAIVGIGSFWNNH